MKRIYIALLLLVSAVLVSCDMDKKPYGSLDETTAIQNLKDLNRLRLGVYTSLRSMTAGSWVYTQDLQMDEFHALINYGNRNGEVWAGSITANTGDTGGKFSGCYGVIATANDLIAKCEAAETQPAFADSIAKVRAFAGEAHFLRAYAYFYLVDHFCQPYTAANGDTPHLGMPIVTTYNPSGDIASYPSRGTLNETYQLIESDLDDALSALTTYEQTDRQALVPNARYLSSYAVLAMQARVALVKGDYATALAKARQVIASDIYSLTSLNDYAKLWTQDEGTEVIFRPIMSSTEGLVSTGAAYTASANQTEADYIPTFETLNMYGDADIRFDAFFQVWNLDVSGTRTSAFVFQKFPGNTALRTTSTNNYVNMMKPFRLSETYLIAAEAAAQTGDVAAAQDYLNTLRSKRIRAYRNQSFTATTIMPAIKSERKKELIGEGFLFSDLRRWGEGFERYASHDENAELNNLIVKTADDLRYEAGDYRFTWPIPQAELDANPQIAGEQNPGY